MTIKTEINGLPFEISLPDGLIVEFSNGKIVVANQFSSPVRLWPNGYDSPATWRCTSLTTDQVNKTLQAQNVQTEDFHLKSWV